MAAEANLKRRCLKVLRERGVKVIATTGVSEAGTPDLLGCFMGRCIAIELKAPGKHPRPLQVKRLDEWKKAGAVVGVVHSIEELLELLAGIPVM